MPQRQELYLMRGATIHADIERGGMGPMRRLRRFWGLLVALVALSVPLGASEVRGTIAPRETGGAYVTAAASGPVSVRLAWQRRATDLSLVVTCLVDSSAMVYGVSQSATRRQESLEVGVQAHQVCRVGVYHMKGPETPYWLTITLSEGTVEPRRRIPELEAAADEAARLLGVSR